MIAEIDYLEQNNENSTLENKVETSSETNNVKQEENDVEEKDKKNKTINKVSELAQVYSVVTQGFFMMLVVALIGFAIGKWGMKSDIWAAILAVFGTLIGLVIFISLLWRLKIGGLGSGKEHNESKRDE